MEHALADRRAGGAGATGGVHRGPACGLVLVGLSGGADSLALAVAASEAARTQDGRPGDQTRWRVGAVVVDHGLHPDSAGVSERTAQIARTLGLDPVLVRKVHVPTGAEPGADQGPEAAARTVRHHAFAGALEETGAAAVLLAHTRDDQAEQVLLGLARGSGTRSLAGIPAARGQALRPLLDLDREETEQICSWAGLRWWTDPANADPAFLRSRIRTSILPFLEDAAEGLGPGLRGALARTAQIAAEDAHALELWAAAERERLTRPPAEPGGTSGDLSAGDRSDRRRDPAPAACLDLEGLAALPTAVRLRVIRGALQDCGAEDLTRERIQAADRLVQTRSEGGTSAGPVQLPGGVVVLRRRSGGCARLEVYAPGPATARELG